MSVDTSAWMPLWIGDYLKATQRLSTQQHGAYLLLIMDYWQSGRLNDDDAELARITRLPAKEWVKIKPKIICFFIKTEGQYWHARIEEELSAAKKNRIKSAERAAKGGAATKAYWAKINELKNRA